MSPLATRSVNLKKQVNQRKGVARPSRNQDLNAETQRNAEKRREEELSAILCGSLRLCVKSSQQSIDNYPSLRSLRSLRLTQLPFPI